MYAQQNLDPELHPNFKLLIRELNAYGRTVKRIHILPNKWVFYVDPPYNGNNTIEIDYISNPDKELDRAIKKIRSILEFEKIQDKNLEIKSRILNEFKEAYTGLIKTPEDFYQFYEGLIDLAASNFVSPEQLKQIISIYNKKKPYEIIILPPVGKYGSINLEDLKVIQRQSYLIFGPTIEEVERIVVKEGEEFLNGTTPESRELAKKIIGEEKFFLNLIESLEKHLISSGECDLNDPEEKDFPEYRFPDMEV